MWKVVVKGKKPRVCFNWDDTMIFVIVANEKNLSVKVKPLQVDVFIFDDNGDLIPAANRISPQTAARYAVRWARMDRNQSGCLIWPHGKPLPSNLKVATNTEATA